MDKKKTEDLECGIIMPISPIDGLSSEHWKEVLSIISDAITKSNFIPNLVSNGTDVGVIQKRIIQNLYKNPIVVCDVSAKNANVMFELGMRLAFDKPTIIIKDDKTNYSFDTSPIEHLEYPRDLRFASIVRFKEELSKKITNTYNASVNNPKYTTFLKHFGEYKISNLEEKEISSDKFLIESIDSIKQELSSIRRENNRDFVYEKYFDEEEIKRRVVYAHISSFVQENNLDSEYQIRPAGLQKKLYDSLLILPEVKNLIKSRKELDKYVDDYLEVPF